jgi:hypothetical protein
MVRWPAAVLLACAPLLQQWSCTLTAACCLVLASYDRWHSVLQRCSASTCCPLEHVDACAVYSLVRAFYAWLYHARSCQARPGQAASQPACQPAGPNQWPCMPPLPSLCLHLGIYVRSCLTIAVAEWIPNYWHACRGDVTAAAVPAICQQPTAARCCTVLLGRPVGWPGSAPMHGLMVRHHCGGLAPLALWSHWLSPLAPLDSSGTISRHHSVMVRGHGGTIP